jgi:glutamate-ammonia-ligase adenylyltransferase
VVAGDAGLARRFERARAAVLRRQRDPARVAAEIRAMRGLVAAEKPAAGPFDLKLAAGGFVDIEFIAQYLQLVHARQHAALLEQNTGEVLARLAAAGILSPAAGTALREAWQLESTLAAWLTLMEAKGSTAGALPPPLRARLVAAAHLPDGRLLERHLMEVQGRVRDLFGEIIGTPD